MDVVFGTHTARQWATPTAEGWSQALLALETARARVFNDELPNSTRQPHPVHRATHPRREPQRNLTDRRTTAIREPHANLLVRCINQGRTNLDRVAPLTMPPGLL